MAFWGIEVKPGKPYTHSFKTGGGRLRISQATLGTGSATQKSLVQCNVGEKSPVLLCALLPDKTESLQLDLEFEEAEDVMFSVIGPRGVYLTGYYVGHNRQSNMQDDTESYGEDIANSETQESNHYSDEDEYDDSFINDDEPEPLTPSPVSSGRDDDEGEYPKNKINGHVGHRRLKKKYRSVESDDEMSIPDIDDEDDFPISSICKNNKSEAPGRKTIKETPAKLDKGTKNIGDKHKMKAVGSPVLDSKDEVDVHLANEKTNGGSDPHESLLPSAQIPVNEVKAKKKKKEHSKKGNVGKSDDENDIRALKDKRQQSKVECDSMDHDVQVAKDNPKPNDTEIIDRSLEVLPSAEVCPEKVSKPKKKRKGRAEANTDGTNNNLPEENKLEDDQQAIDNSGNGSKQLADANQSEEKKVKKKRRKTKEVDENTNIEGKKVNKPSTIETEGKNEDSMSSNKRTLSNGLVIEDLVTGKSKGKKVAASGRKVKVQYVVKLKENGQVIDSNGKLPHKFKLGDQEVIEGLNVGLDGMRVGDKRRITVPPSMSLGYHGTGENIPPNSWLVYYVEMVSIH